MCLLRARACEEQVHLEASTFGKQKRAASTCLLKTAACSIRKASACGKRMLAHSSGVRKTQPPPNKTVTPHTPTNNAEKETTRHEFEKSFSPDTPRAPSALSWGVGGDGFIWRGLCNSDTLHALHIIITLQLH